jgi:hypothetical protein
MFAARPTRTNRAHSRDRFGSSPDFDPRRARMHVTDLPDSLCSARPEGSDPRVLGTGHGGLTGISPTNLSRPVVTDRSHDRRHRASPPPGGSGSGDPVAPSMTEDGGESRRQRVSPVGRRGGRSNDVRDRRPGRRRRSRRGISGPDVSRLEAGDGGDGGGLPDEPDGARAAVHLDQLARTDRPGSGAGSHHRGEPVLTSDDRGM